MNIQVIHTLAKPFSKLHAGIYIQSPQQGVPDRQGIYYRHIQEEISVTDNPNDVIARCIDKVFLRSKDVDSITYIGPSGKRIEVERGVTPEEIRERIREG